MSKKNNVEAKADLKFNMPVTLKIVETKADDEKGIIEAYVSIFDNVDLVGDIIKRGAFAESLAKKLPKGVWGHDWNVPVAKTLEAREDEKGLYIKAQFNLDTQRGQEAYSDIKFGIIDEFSIGFRVLDDEWTEDNIRVITKARLYEWSPVLVGANPDTELISVKSKKEKEKKGIIEDELNYDEDDQRKKWKMLYKMDDVLYTFYDVYLRYTTKSTQFSELIEEINVLLKKVGADYENLTKSLDEVKELSGDEKKEAFNSLMKMFKQEVEKGKEASVKKVDFVKVDEKAGIVELFYKDGEERKSEVLEMSDKFKKYQSELKAHKTKVVTSNGEGVASQLKILRIRQVAKQNIKSSQYLLRITKSK